MELGSFAGMEVDDIPPSVWQSYTPPGCDVPARLCVGCEAVRAAEMRTCPRCGGVDWLEFHDDRPHPRFRLSARPERLGRQLVEGQVSDAPQKAGNTGFQPSHTTPMTNERRT